MDAENPNRTKVKQHTYPIDPLLDELESIRKIVISTKADSPQFRSLLSNMIRDTIRQVETIKAVEQIPLSAYNVVTSLLSPLLDTQDKLLLEQLKTQQENTVVSSLEQHINERKALLDNASHKLHNFRSAIERVCVLLKEPPEPDSSDEQLCKKIEEGLREHLHDNSLLRREIQNLIKETRVTLQTISTVLRQTGDNANDIAEIENILKQDLPNDPKDAQALLQQTRKALLKTSEKLSKSNSKLHQAMQSQVKSIENLSQRLEEAENQANKDSLTGLANRRKLGLFMSKLDENTVALIMVDIDRFKSVNDRYGHLVGDKVLADVASLLASNVRTTDIAARFGGEEFCIILPGATHELAIAKAIKLKEIIAEHTFDTEAGKIPITASFGVAMRQHGESVPQWTKRADSALYEAKQSGRNKVISAEN